MNDGSLNVLMSGGFAGAYENLLPAFERGSGIKVTTGSGASQGTGPQTIGAQLARGVPADMVILSREGLDELIAANRIAVGTDVDLARVPLGVAVRAGTPHPDVSTVEAFKEAVLRAKTVVVPGSTSGIWLRTDLFPRLGVAERINVKVGQRGTDATAMVAAGEADVAVMPVSEIVPRARRRFRRRHPTRNPVRADVCSRRRRRLDRDGSVQTPDRISRLRACVRRDQGKRNGAGGGGKMRVVPNRAQSRSTSSKDVSSRAAPRLLAAAARPTKKVKLR